MIDSRAVIDPRARLGCDVHIGPFSVVGAEVEIGDRTWIGPHVVLEGPTRMGCDNRIHAFSAIGGPPQDKKYRGEDTLLVIGDRNVIREYCTINRGTVQDQSMTRIGHDNWIMAYVHVAHDCSIGNHTVFANNASLAGHVHVHDYTVLGGYTLVYQFCHLGAYSFTSFGSGIHQDVPPFIMADGHRAEPRGINIEGLRRNGFSDEEILSIRRAYKILYKSDFRLDQAIEAIRSELLAQCSSVQLLLDFLTDGQRDRSIIR